MNSKIEGVAAVGTTEATRASPGGTTPAIVDVALATRADKMARPKMDSSDGSPALPAAIKSPSPPEQPEIIVHIEVVCGGITSVKVPVAIGPRYQNLPLAGPAKAFDRLLDCWLTRAIDLGMIGSGLGQLFPVNLQRAHQAGAINVEHLLIAGMGEPGQFAQDDLRYLTSNITVAVKSLRQNHLSTLLIGTRRGELPFNRAVRGFLDGILDGYERFRAIANGVTAAKEHFQEAASQDLFVTIVEPDAGRAERIFNAFNDVSQDGQFQGLHLEVARGDDVAPDPVPDPNAIDVEPDVPVTLLRVTRQEPAVPTTTSATPFPLANTGTEIFRFSAMSDAAAVTVRDVEVNSYLIRELPNRMTAADSSEGQLAFGAFFENYLIPDDLRRLVESAANLTLIVDETTAAYPWEMAAYRRYFRTHFLGEAVGMSRRFHSLLSPPPSSLPPLNETLKVLIIADPAPGKLALPHAREEALAILGVLDQARQRWQGTYSFRVNVRVGSKKQADLLESQCEKLRQLGDWVESAEPCDPLELALLVVNEHFDVIHYAGHGAFDRKAQRAGWVFDEDCFLSAQEIFRVRQVPRLVFANACFSAVTADHCQQRGQLFGLAQAFFARGIPNYIGAGWEVNDACATVCARAFYSQVLGLHGPNSPPATIGDALLAARRAVLDLEKGHTTWGAYQHYGAVNDKLLPLPNARNVSKS
jgi:hypothetical protein